jgi:hypothetical protein
MNSACRAAGVNGIANKMERSFGRPWHTWQNVIKMDIREIEHEGFVLLRIGGGGGAVVNNFLFR